MPIPPYKKQFTLFWIKIPERTLFELFVVLEYRSRMTTHFSGCCGGPPWRSSSSSPHRSDWRHKKTEAGISGFRLGSGRGSPLPGSAALRPGYAGIGGVGAWQRPFPGFTQECCSAGSGYPPLTRRATG